MGAEFNEKLNINLRNSHGEQREAFDYVVISLPSDHGIAIAAQM